jgi:hypothetical protein
MNIQENEPAGHGSFETLTNDHDPQGTPFGQSEPGERPAQPSEEPMIASRNDSPREARTILATWNDNARQTFGTVMAPYLTLLLNQRSTAKATATTNDPSQLATSGVPAPIASEQVNDHQEGAVTRLIDTAAGGSPPAGEARPMQVAAVLEAAVAQREGDRTDDGVKFGDCPRGGPSEEGASRRSVVQLLEYLASACRRGARDEALAMLTRCPVSLRAAARVLSLFWGSAPNESEAVRATSNSASAGAPGVAASSASPRSSSSKRTRTMRGAPVQLSPRISQRLSLTFESGIRTSKRFTATARSVTWTPIESIARQALPADEPVVGGEIRVRQRRPDGNVVEIKVKAASRTGKSVRTRNRCGLILDKASFFHADEGDDVTAPEGCRAAALCVGTDGRPRIVSPPWIEGIRLLEAKRPETRADITRSHEKTLDVPRVGTRLLAQDFHPTSEIEANLGNNPESAADELAAHAAGRAPPVLPAVPSARMVLGGMGVSQLALGASGPVLRESRGSGGGSDDARA